MVEAGDLYLCNLVSRGGARLPFFTLLYTLFIRQTTRSFVFTRNSYVQLYSPAGRRVYYTNYYYVVRSTVVCTVQVYILLILTSLGLRYLYIITSDR